MQWDIVRARVRRRATTLVLIGDPKQAIYAFRGADVYAYLEAARAAGASATLEVNWRSDQGLIEAYDALFGGARLGHEGIAYRTRARRRRPTARRGCSALRDREPLRVRVVHRDDPTVDEDPLRLRGQRLLARGTSRTDLAGDLVAAALLGRADRAPRGGRRGARAASRCGRGTSRCSCARTARRRSCARRSTRSRSPR